MTPEDIQLLRKLKELCDGGVITEAEFESQKQRLLAREPDKATSNGGDSFRRPPDRGLARDEKMENAKVSLIPSGVEGLPIDKYGPNADRESINRWIPKALSSIRRRRAFLIVVTCLSLVVLPLLLFRGAESFNRSAVDDEILFLYPSLGPNSREEYQEFVRSACQWDEADEMAFAEDRVSEFSESESLALDYFRSFDGLEDFRRLVSIGCGTGRADEIFETLAEGSGVLLPKAFLTKLDDYEGEDYDIYLPVDDLSLGYGEFSPEHRIFAAWWRTVFAEVDGPSASSSTLTPDSEFKFWKRVRVDDQFEYFFCVQRNDVCDPDKFLRLYWEERAWVFVGLGRISQVESDLGNPGKLFIEPAEGSVKYPDSVNPLKCTVDVELGRFCFIFRAIALITSSQDEQAFLLNVKSNFENPRENIISLEEMTVFDGSKSYRLLPCRLDAGGEFIRDANLVFLDRNPDSKYIFEDGFVTAYFQFGDQYLSTSAFGQEVNFLMCLEKGARTQFRGSALQISAPMLAETESDWFWQPESRVPLSLPCQILDVQSFDPGCFDLQMP